jgi:hypothetical protein
MNVLKCLMIYLMTMQLAFAGKVQNSLINYYPSFTNKQMEKEIVSIVAKFKKFKQVKDYLQVVKNPNLITQINKYKNAQSARVLFKDGVVHVRNNHLVTKIVFDLENGKVRVNGKKIDLRNLKDNDDYWNQMEKVLREKKVSGLFELIIPEAKAEFLLIAIAVISFSVVIDALVSTLSRDKCQEKARYTMKQLKRVEVQCKEDMVRVINSQVKKNDTETARYLQNIFNRLDSIRPEDFNATSCEEAVSNQYENWQIYRFQSCVEQIGGFVPEVTSQGMCDQIKLVEKCINSFVELDPNAVTNRNHEENPSINDQNSVEQSGNPSGSNQ